MIELKVINKGDPLKRNAEKQQEQKEFSPMAPPDAYAPPNMKTIPYEELHPFLQQLCDEHKACIKELDAFEEALNIIRKTGIDKSVGGKLSRFFNFFDNNIVVHNQKEDKILFPLLQKRLLEQGEHGHGPTPITAVDMLEDDHIKALQLAAVVFNFFGMSMRLPEHNSRLVLLDAALEQGKALIELLRLHIFREDNIVFPQAQMFLSNLELDEMASTIRP